MKKLLAIGLTSLMLTGCATATQPSKTETATSKTAEAETRLDSQIPMNANHSAFLISKSNLKERLEGIVGKDLEYYQVDNGYDRVDLSSTLTAEVTMDGEFDRLSALAFVFYTADINEILPADFSLMTGVLEMFSGYSGNLMTTAVERCRSAVYEYGYGSGEAIDNHLKLSVGVVPGEDTVLGLFVLTPAFDEVDEDGDTSGANTKEPSKPKEQAKEETETKGETPKATAPTESAGQKNAVNKAQSYLSFMSFSRSGLIEQLEYEGFSNEEATYAVDKINPDWNEQAANKAQDYLDTMSFSYDGLIEQLEFEGFTPEQAQYGVSKVYK
ncbi:Ltp family lipoprotein [Faecalibaculum rodentium]|jgi:hypothetical protein|uniref:Ltp family lipoprotein n=1 Tax=Faecalibaculum rodentium TaxID=1702221 RepID=UPI001C3E04E7|nr:Ltp family lipoprotein [Faecalibaculum rodentium]